STCARRCSGETSIACFPDDQHRGHEGHRGKTVLLFWSFVSLVSFVLIVGIDRAQCPRSRSVRDRSKVLAQQIAPEVPVEVAPHGMNVVPVVLRVVVLDEEGRSLN